MGRAIELVASGNQGPSLGARYINSVKVRAEESAGPCGLIHKCSRSAIVTSALLAGRV